MIHGSIKKFDKDNDVMFMFMFNMWQNREKKEIQSTLSKADTFVLRKMSVL